LSGQRSRALKVRRPIGCGDRLRIR
jgi:hypothetical protein